MACVNLDLSRLSKHTHWCILHSTQVIDLRESSRYRLTQARNAYKGEQEFAVHHNQIHWNLVTKVLRFILNTWFSLHNVEKLHHGCFPSVCTHAFYTIVQQDLRRKHLDLIWFCWGAVKILTNVSFALPSSTSSRVHIGARDTSRRNLRCQPLSLIQNQVSCYHGSCLFGCPVESGPKEIASMSYLSPFLI